MSPSEQEALTQQAYNSGRRHAQEELDRLQKIVDQANAAGFIDEKGEVRKVLTSATNTDRPVYATAMFIGETVVVLSSRGGA